MQEYPIPYYVVEFLSEEWIIWSTFSLIFIVTPLVFAKYLNSSQKKYLLYIMGVLLIIEYTGENLKNILNGFWSIQYNLPIHLCGMSTVICCFLPFIKKQKKWFEFVYYTGILGGLMAILTPQINQFDGQLSEYVNYYSSHSLIILIPLYMYMYQGAQLTKLSWLRLFFYLNLLVIIVMPINFIIGSNYMYLNELPGVDNPLIIGEWPYYILFWELFVMLLAYLLYVITKRRIAL
tara:strand:- start:28 stop:732 length:705 start_codon:yes stop_codon:yes gene_type:complete